jgi:hypothetical protein
MYRITIFTLVIAAVGCGGVAVTDASDTAALEPNCPAPDAAGDGATDAQPEASAEAAPEAGPEAASDTGTSPEADAPPDAYEDAYEDAGAEAGACIAENANCEADGGDPCCPGLTCQPVPYTHPIPDRCLPAPTN